MPKEVLNIRGYVVTRPVKELKCGDRFGLSLNTLYDLERLNYDRKRKLYKANDIRNQREVYVSGDTYAVIDCNIWEIWEERRD